MSGQGQPVLLIHGSMNSKTQWRLLVDQLNKRFKVIAIDLYGYGDTSFPENPASHTLMDEVELIRRTLRSTIGLDEPVHLVAHSYGGTVGLCYACHYQEEIRSLTLFEPMANQLLLDFETEQFFQEGRKLIDLIAHQVDQNDPRTGAQTFIDYFSGKGIFSILPQKAQNTLTQYVVKMLVDYRATIESPLSLEDYRRIDCPTCLISGQTSSQVSLAIAHILKENLPRVKWVEVQGNHMAKK